MMREGNRYGRRTTWLTAHLTS